jgi:hypothetical protein
MTKSADEERKLRKALVGSSTEVTSYRDWAVNDIALEAQGRHATKSTVVGAKAVPLYPAASGPWNDPVQVPDEPPLGWSVDSQECVGRFSRSKRVYVKPHQSLLFLLMRPKRARLTPLLLRVRPQPPGSCLPRRLGSLLSSVVGGCDVF